MIAKTFNFYKLKLKEGLKEGLKEKGIWDSWNKNYDEQHIWGDLSKEEEQKLQDILKGKDNVSI